MISSNIYGRLCLRLNREDRHLCPRLIATSTLFAAMRIRATDIPVSVNRVTAFLDWYEVINTARSTIAANGPSHLPCKVSIGTHLPAQQLRHGPNWLS